MYSKEYFQTFEARILNDIDINSFLSYRMPPPETLVYICQLLNYSKLESISAPLTEIEWLS